MADEVLDLRREELRELGSAFVRQQGDTPEAFGLYAVAATSPWSELPRAVEREVFREFFGNAPEVLEVEYGPYESATVFVFVMDHRRGLPAGMTRLILPSDFGFKSLDDLEVAWNQRVPEVFDRTGIAPALSEVLDVVTIAVDGEYRRDATNGLISLGLYQGVVQTARYADLRWLVTILDLIVLKLINDLTTAPFLRYRGVEPLNYLDSPASLPVYCDFAEYMPRLHAADVRMHGILREAVGLEAALRRLPLLDDVFRELGREPVRSRSGVLSASV